jgi:hypothetical protein
MRRGHKFKWPVLNEKPRCGLTKARRPRKYFNDQTLYLGDTEMPAERCILVSLLSHVEYLPSPPPQKRKRGRQETYSYKLFIKALIVMIIRRFYTAYALARLPRAV